MYNRKLMCYPYVVSLFVYCWLKIICYCPRGSPFVPQIHKTYNFIVNIMNNMAYQLVREEDEASNPKLLSLVMFISATVSTVHSGLPCLHTRPLGTEKSES